MDRLEKLKVPLSAALSSLPSPPDNLRSEEWNELHECISILKPVEQLTVKISGEQYPTLSSVIPLIRGTQHLLRNNFPDTDIAKQLKKTLVDVIDNRLGCVEINKTAAKATFMDPRFKKAAFGTEENADRVQRYVVEELTQFMRYNLINQDRSSTSNSFHESQEQQQQSTEGYEELWQHFDQKVHDHMNVETPTSSALIKVKQYVELPYLERKLNPIEFWENRKKIDSGLYEISLKYLSIPATSVPSERVFSKAGLVCNQRKNRLEPKKIDQILFLNAYLSSEKVNNID
ncbi:PREDICTED: zinc finger BED domain-containing protein 1-like [Cyphomyrmex costatus]|uniref:zinc finger BED domain-containing protein 1-like n=1 Tax=Cyphomyrmex costatus TaxID=456900 RepID=UPI00085243DF|nr:PREDICTED: zinc finger BED domain-containing protein 1-like [Cyphomyrmex costatus]